MKRYRMIAFLTLYGFAIAGIAADPLNFSDFVDYGEANGYQVYWNWKESSSGSNLVGAWMNEDGEVVEDAEFDENGDYTGGEVFYSDPLGFNDWYEGIFGTSSRPCEFYDTCIGEWQMK